MALGVLAHVAAEFIVNLGRTLRFYSDRYGNKLSTEVSGVALHRAARC